MNEMLSTAHLQKLTGRSQYAAQRRWLEARGWVYEPDSKGEPQVDRGYYNMRMGLGEQAPAPVELDFSKLYG